MSDVRAADVEGGAELEAGRGLDERIAVEVLGLGRELRTMPDHEAMSRSPYAVMLYDTFFANGARLPRYSRDMAAAWEVVEAFEAGRVVGDKPGWPDAHGWYVSIYRSPGGWGASIGATAVAFATTAPLAICLAAIAAATSNPG